MMEPFEPVTGFALQRKISWQAILAGVVVTLASQLLLGLLGIGIGASTMHPSSPDGASAQTIGTGSAIWFFLSGLVSLFAGGWVAGRLAAIPRATEAVLHGLITWCLVALLTVYLIGSTAGSLIAGAGNALGSLVSGAGNGIAAAAPSAQKAIDQGLAASGMSVESVTDRAERVLRETGNPKLTASQLRKLSKHDVALARAAAHRVLVRGGSVQTNYNDLIYRFLHDSDSNSHTQNRAQLINVVAAEQHVTHAQAAKTVDGWASDAARAQQQAEQITDQLRERAKQAADQTAADVAKAALSAFTLLLVGAIAAGLGGLLSMRSLLTKKAVAVASFSAPVVTTSETLPTVTSDIESHTHHISSTATDPTVTTSGGAYTTYSGTPSTERNMGEASVHITLPPDAFH